MKPKSSSKLVLKNKVGYYRTMQGLTQEQLANKCGTTRNTIYAIETEKFIPSTFLSSILCIALDVKYEDLFYLEIKK